MTVAILTDPAFDVPAEPDGPSGTVAWLRHHVARFSPGERHPARREIVERLLAPLDPATLRQRAFEQVRSGDDPAEAAAVVPVAVLAIALGAPADAIRDVVADVRTMAAVYLPPAEPDATADAAVARLVAVFGGRFDDETANRVGLLAQAANATRLLIMTSFPYGQPPGEAVAEALRDDPPAKATRRTELRTGETIAVELTGAPFGAGRHACPGQAQAVALATGVIEALRS